MKNKELNFIINVLEDKQINIDTKKLDWYSIIGFLDSNKISVIFLNKIIKNQIKIPYDIVRILRYKECFQIEKNKIMSNWILKLSTVLIENNINHVFLKGSVLNALYFNSNKFYDDGERISNDIDVLIKKEELKEVSKLLYELGFVQGKFNLETNTIEKASRYEIINSLINYGEVIPFIKKTDNSICPYIEIDINFSLNHLPIYNKKLLNDMFKNKKIINYNSEETIYSLDLYDMFIHLIIHQYKEMIVLSMVRKNKDYLLYKIIDLIKLIDNIDLFDEKFLNKINEYNLKNETYHVLKVVNEIFKRKNINNFINLLNVDESLSIIDYENNQKKYKWIRKTKEIIKNYYRMNYLTEKFNE